MRRSTWLGIALAVATTAVIACRQDQPAGDPKTPANSPIPEPEKHDDDPKSGPKLPSLGDAG